jgi:hypothetical protein
MTLDHTKVPGSTIMVLGHRETDEFAARETGHRDHFWGRPPRAGG